MINQYTKYLTLPMLMSWIIGASACFAAEPFTPRHPYPVHESWRWRSFPELKGQGASCLAQDGDGNFLFGTDDGIYLYDGMRWHLFPFDEEMEGTRINALYVARDAVDERAEMEGAGYDKRIWIRTRGENDAVVIEVRDNGVGMEEVTRRRLFEPFFTTKGADRGTGLGLSIIYAIVRNHDGEITAESEQGLGTTFKVMLPVVEKDSALVSMTR